MKIFKQIYSNIKNWFDVKSQNDYLRLQLAEANNRIGDPKEVLLKIFPNLEWFDYNDLPIKERINYFNEAQMILRTNIFNNEFNRLKSTMAVDLSLNAVKFEQIRDYQMTINGIQLLKEVFENIENPNKLPELNDDILAPI